MSASKNNSVRPAIETLEQRDTPSVSSVSLSGDNLVIKTDNASTSVNLTQVGSNIRVSEVGTSRYWDNASYKVHSVEFQGGAGNDRFVSYVQYMPVKAMGGAGNDYLESYDAADVLMGGDGDDTLVGYGGNDILNGGAGNDTLNGGAGDDILISIDNSLGDTLTGGAGRDTYWTDYTRQANFTAHTMDNMTDLNYAEDKIQAVERFANGADRTLNGDRITDPNATINFTREDGTSYSSTYDYKQFAGNPLFSSGGPSVSDIKQGGIGDCWLMAGLESVAQNSPQTLRQNVVDFGDGTYGVRLGDNFYRVDNDLAVNSSSQPVFAQLGVQNSMWAAVVEKAYAHYRTGANSYQSLSGGWGREVAKAFGSSDASTQSFTSAAALGKFIDSHLTSNELLTVGIDWWNSSTNSYSRHELDVASVQRNSLGVVTSVTLRNPWGYDGKGIKINGSFITDSNTSDGMITLTIDQLYKLNPAVSYGKL